MIELRIKDIRVMFNRSLSSHVRNKDELKFDSIDVNINIEFKDEDHPFINDWIAKNLTFSVLASKSHDIEDFIKGIVLNHLSEDNMDKLNMIAHMTDKE